MAPGICMRRNHLLHKLEGGPDTRSKEMIQAGGITLETCRNHEIDPYDVCLLFPRNPGFENAVIINRNQFMKVYGHMDIGPREDLWNYMADNFKKMYKETKENE